MLTELVDYAAIFCPFYYSKTCKEVFHLQPNLNPVSFLLFYLQILNSSGGITPSIEEAFTILPTGKYACNICCKETASKQAAVYHFRLHTGEKPFACFYCKYRCAQKGNLMVHCTRVHKMSKDHFYELCRQTKFE